MEPVPVPFLPPVIAGQETVLPFEQVRLPLIHLYKIQSSPRYIHSYPIKCVSAWWGGSPILRLHIAFILNWKGGPLVRLEGQIRRITYRPVLNIFFYSLGNAG